LADFDWAIIPFYQSNFGSIYSKLDFITHRGEDKCGADF